MTETDNKPSRDERGRHRTGRILSIIVPVVYLVGFSFMAADATYLNLRPLAHLGISFPSLLLYAHWIIPGIAAVVWLSLRRKLPWVSVALAIVLCVGMLDIVAWYAESRTEKIPTSRFLTQEEKDTLAARLSFPIWEQGSRKGCEIFVEKGADRSQRLTEELRKLNLLRTSEAVRSDHMPSGEQGGKAE